MIKPIETIYSGYRFRSRLEARWAVFFDAAKIKYQYEPQGFEAEDGTRYLPDFYLPDFDVYAEVKPTYEKLMEESDKLGKILSAYDSPIGALGLLILGQIPEQYTNFSGEEKFYNNPMFLYYWSFPYHKGKVCIDFRSFVRYKGETILMDSGFMQHESDTYIFPDIREESICYLGKPNSIQEQLDKCLSLSGYHISCESGYDGIKFHLPTSIAKESYDYFTPCFNRAKQARFEHGERPEV